MNVFFCFEGCTHPIGRLPIQEAEQERCDKYSGTDIFQEEGG